MTLSAYKVSLATSYSPQSQHGPVEREAKQRGQQHLRAVRRTSPLRHLPLQAVVMIQKLDDCNTRI